MPPPPPPPPEPHAPHPRAPARGARPPPPPRRAEEREALFQVAAAAANSENQKVSICRTRRSAPGAGRASSWARSRGREAGKGIRSFPGRRFDPPPSAGPAHIPRASRGRCVRSVPPSACFFPHQAGGLVWRPKPISDSMADAVAAAAANPNYVDAEGRSISDPETEKTACQALVKVLGTVLTRLVATNDANGSGGSGVEDVTKFHALRPPSISISDYLERIARYSSCSKECFVLALVYIDRIVRSNGFIVSSLNVHRLVITAVMLAAKFFDDQYYNNAYYAKVGGVPCSEINSLELEFLFLVNFSLHVATDDFEQYRLELEQHHAAHSQNALASEAPPAPSLMVPGDGDASSSGPARGSTSTPAGTSAAPECSPEASVATAAAASASGGCGAATAEAIEADHGGATTGVSGGSEPQKGEMRRIYSATGSGEGAMDVVGEAVQTSA